MWKRMLPLGKAEMNDLGWWISLFRGAKTNDYKWDDLKESSGQVPVRSYAF